MSTFTIRLISLLSLMIFSCPMALAQSHPIQADTAAACSKKIYYKGSGPIKKVALTFDDGPDTKITVRILDILKKENVHASFFVVGRLVKKNPAIFQRILREGHMVAIHAWTHPNLIKLTTAEIQSQLQRTSAIIEHYSGKKPLFFRPPYGSMNDKVKKIVRSEGLTTVIWNIDTKDWQGPEPQKILNRVSSKIVPGSIILQHSAGGTRRLESTVDALPEIIQLLKKQEYQIVTVDELLHAPAYKN